MLDRRLPNWLRAVFVAFGVANMVGATVRLDSVMTPAGLVIGGVWALVGWIGGLPPLPTVPRRLPPGVDAVVGGMRVLRRRRRWAYAAFLAFLPTAAFVFSRIPEHWMPGIFFPMALLFSVPIMRFSLSACPRCGRLFALSQFVFRRRVTLPSACGHCGLSLR